MHKLFVGLIKRTASARPQFRGCSSTTNAHNETGQMSVCCQNLPLGALSSRSALSMLFSALFKKFGLFLNTGVCLGTIMVPLTEEINSTEFFRPHRDLIGQSPASKSVWIGPENLAHIELRTTDRPALDRSLQRLPFPG